MVNPVELLESESSIVNVSNLITGALQRISEEHEHRRPLVEVEEHNLSQLSFQDEIKEEQSIITNKVCT